MNAPINILLVDDEPKNLDALEAILTREDYRLLRAEDADRALRLLLENDVAAIVLDIRMPRIDGLELARMIKGTKRFRQIPLLFLTAHMVEDQDVLTGYGVGAVDYLTKPFNPQILRHKIGIFADLFRKTRELAELNEKLDQRVKERTAELETSETALRAAARQKDEFLATLAHELRNPLAPLRTGLGVLTQAGLTNNDITRRTLSVMNRQLDHIIRLIDDLLDVSRIGRGVLELKKEKTDVSRLLETTAETFRPLLEQREVSLLVSTTPSITAVVDPTRIAQIIGNLLHNTSKFTPPGGGVHLELEIRDGQAVARVTDSGVGIPEGQIDRVFEMFQHSDGASAHGSAGAGIGLALAKKLAQMHGGDLFAFSKGEGHGATFTLVIPDALQEPTEPVQQEKVAFVPTSGKPLDILIIEDHEDVAQTLATWLEELGHRLTIARTGIDGVKLAQAKRPQVVLCDLGLPGMDGVEVCLRVRQLSVDFKPVMVALTGWGKDEDKKRTRDAGFDHHLVKPVALDTLFDVLRSVEQSAEALVS